MLSKLRDFVESYSNELFLMAVIILVGLVSFGLGQLSAGGASYGGELILESAPVEINKLVEALNSPGAEQGSAIPTDIIGNKSSKIYHRSDCAGAKIMSEANKIYFNSIAEAKNAGYRPAGNCPGLE